MKYFNRHYWMRKLFVNSFFSKILGQNLLNKIVFNAIYKSNHWNKSKKFDHKEDSFSGPGSVPNSKQTNNLIIELTNFFKENDIKTFLDAPCGDCAWISKLFLSDIQYTGIDIVEDLITINKEKYSNYKNINFYNKDLLNFNNYDSYDFVLLRDFFIHLPLKSILKILENLKNSKCKYFAFNNYSNIVSNKEISTGQHRKLNLTIEPFNLKKPDFKIQEIKNDNFPDAKNIDNYIYIYKNRF